MDFLKGIRVVDFTGLLPGPCCTMALADLGAGVIRVERPGEGDYARQHLPGVFWTANRNKQSVTVDFKAPAGREICQRLIATADVVVEAFRPGVMARAGLDYDTVSRDHPGLIYCSISGYGQTGPLAAVPGHELNYLSLAGGLAIPADQEFPPLRPGLPVGDFASGMYAALSITAALYRRRVTGQGEYVDVAIADAILGVTSFRLGELLQEGRKLDLTDWPHLTPANRVYACADGKRLAIGAVEDKFWQSLCQAISRPDLAAAPEFATNPDRVRRFHDLAPVLSAAFRQRSRDQWVEVLEQFDVPFSPVLEMEELVAHPQLQAREMFAPVGECDGQQSYQVAFPVHFRHATWTTRSLPPELGADTRDLLLGLGYSEADLAALHSSGVI